MTSFPIVLLPYPIEEAKRYYPPCSDLPQPQVPQELGKLQLLAKPGQIPQPPTLNQEVLYAGLWLVLFLALISRGALLIPGLAVLGVIWLQVDSENSKYERRKQDWESHKRAYEDQQAKLQESMDASAARKLQHQNEWKAYEKRVEEIRRNRILKVLRTTVPHDGTKWSQSGRSEANFLKVLQDYFPDKIHRGLALEIPNNRAQPYRPDFTYIDEASGLCIDIEVDEPYAAIKEKKLTHYIGLDDLRNKFFLERGWIVMRFSEAQVVCSPRSCCRTIAELVSNLLGDNELRMKQFVDVPSLKPEHQWTKEEANEMWAIQVRDNYGCA